ncbi:DNRLRE domain-containing protein [Candidatus Solirubrobacter pratensis]|uniref:DNRLRE domain-containing protein n=1 Tax=Candidatus Solirubrobacter pratensis TaxID=1298857 RepID=UPI000416A3F5|nr:DNRLRE domain-containing protein [Candidatus Solirubrobacter pratensis]
MGDVERRGAAAGRFRQRHGVLVTAAVAALCVAAGAPDGVPARPRPAQAGAEVLSLRTPTSRTFALGGGRFRKEIAAAPVRYRDARGWHAIDTRLRPELATLPADPFAPPGKQFRARGTSFDASFAAAASGEHAAFSVAGRRYGLILRGATPVAGTVSGSTIAYPGVRPGATLVDRTTATGIEQTLVLHDRRAPSNYVFHLGGAADLRAIATHDGGWLFKAPSSSAVALRLLPATVGDARTTDRGVTHDPAHVRTTVKRAGDGYDVAIAVDRRWLGSPSRHFPVTIDPTYTIGEWASVNYDAACSRCATSAPGWLYLGTSSTKAYRIGTQFDLSGFPANATVSGAQLQIYSVGGVCVDTTEPCGAHSHTFDVHRLTQPWGSTTSSFVYDSTALGTATLPADQQDHWLTWNITETLKAWLAGTQPNDGLVIKRSTEPLGAGGPYIEDADPSLTPQIVVTYGTDAVTLDAPQTVHSNGAELTWTRWDGSSGGVFGGYEVHRSTSTGFTPSSSTLLTRIADPAVTSFRDTTAAPSTTYTYKVVVNGAASSAQTVALPASGQARTVLQPGPDSGIDTYIRHNPYMDETASEACRSFGAMSTLDVGSDGILERALLEFDTSLIPAGATVSSASLSLTMTGTADAAITIGAHRITGDWAAGTGVGTCAADGATWTSRHGGIPWAADGADFDPSAASTVSHASGAPATTDRFSVTSMVQKWTDGSAPNLGVLLKAESEPDVLGRWIGYVAADDTWDPADRPKLTVTYADGSRSESPAVTMSSPQNGDVARGTVTVTTAAADDRRVDQVEFLVDGASIGSDTTAPFAAAWSTTGTANGQHTLTARATDDVGNVTTSRGVAVTVANSAPPTTKVTSPGNAYADVVRADGPAAFWRLGEAGGTTAADSSGNGRTAAYGNSYTLAQPGLITSDADKAVLLRNSNKDGQVASSGLSGLLGSQLTAEAWVSYTGVATAGAFDRIVARNWGSAGGWMLAATKDAVGTQRVQWSINAAGTVVTAGAAVTPGRMSLAGTYDGTTLRLYVNGVEAATATRSAAALNTSAAIALGATLDTDITVDDVAVYDKALGATAIKLHDDVGRGRTPTVAGNVAVSADANDDKSVSRVEFLVDGVRYDEDTTAPYAGTLKTLDPANPAFDGQHALTTRAYDGDGQVTTSATATVQVANATGTRYQQDLTSTPFPAAMVYDPATGSQDQAGIDVTVTNRSSATLSGNDVVLRARWYPLDATGSAPAPTDGPAIALGGDVAPGAARTVRALVDPPALADGVNRAQFRLRLDLYEQSTGTWFADKGSPPLQNPVIVDKALATGLGLERYYHYTGSELGAGLQHLLNVANGNSILRWTPWDEPGRGLSTVLDLTYNSLEKGSGSPVGNNFSLSISTLTRFGAPIDIHPNKADDIAGRANRFIDIVDGDGTTHRFTGHQAADGTVYWTEPAGVHLYLRHYSDTDPARAWAFTRPDETTFFYDQDGYPTSVEDNNGNRITFTLQDTPPGEDPGGPKKRIVAVTDAAGTGSSAAPDRAFTIEYYSKADAKAPHVRGQIKRITDHGGDQALRFSYYDDGNLLRLTQAGGTKADGSPLPDRSFVFTYTDSAGSGPAIAVAAQRVDPDPKTPNESTRLFSVADPRGHETTFDYNGPTTGQDRWKLAARTARDGTRTTWAYDTTNRVTTQTAPLARVSKYAYDADGKLTSLTNPNNDVVAVSWTADRMVHQLTEPSGAYTTYDYDDNGYITDVKRVNQIQPALEQSWTHLTYDHPAVDGGDAPGRWQTGRQVAHISRLATTTSPAGMATASPADDYQYDFTYDAKGNLHTVLDPENRASGKVTTYDYNPDGTVARVTDPNGHATAFEAYDANGLPTVVRDPRSVARRATPGFDYVTRLGYDADGLLQWVQDAEHSNESGVDPHEYRSYFYYDAFHRLGRQSAPKSTRLERGILLWSDADFDANDNVLSEVAPHEGRQDTGRGDTTTHMYDAMDRVTLDTGPDTSADPAGERTKYDYDDAGRLIQVTDPKGVATASPDKDFSTILGYDALDRVVSEKRYDYDGSGSISRTLRTQYCYDIAGDLRSVTRPKAGPADVTCSPYADAQYTTKFDYDLAHRLLKRTDGGGNVRTWRYDTDDNVSAYTDEQQLATPARLTYNQRDQLVKDEQPFQTGRVLTTQYVYDPAGNLHQEISPRAFDAAGGGTPNDYLTTYEYDENDQLTRVDLPHSAQETPTYVHRDYDRNGRLALLSLPTTKTSASALTADDSSTYDYWDAGWLHLDNEPGRQNVTYGYSPQGWQQTRVARLGDGAERHSSWAYFPDGMLQSETARDGTRTTYTYDADNQLQSADSDHGIGDAGQQPLHVTAGYDGFDRLTRTRERRDDQSTWKVTTLAYDDNDNLLSRLENGHEDAAGGLSGGRSNEFTYDGADRLTLQLDHGKDSSASATGDDRQILYESFAPGWPKSRTLQKLSSGDWTTTQSTAWTYFQNGDVESLITKNGSGAVKEQHTVSYLDTDGRYIDGNRTKDVFRLDGPDSSKPCRTSDCTRTYAYDGRDRLTGETKDYGTGSRYTKYDLDAPGNVVRFYQGDTDPPPLAATYDYDANQLTTVSDKDGNVQRRYYHDADGNLTCATTGAGTQSDCDSWDGDSRSPNVLEHYRYDRLNRLLRAAKWDPADTLDDIKNGETTWTYDPLDRPAQKVERHGTGPSRTTSYTYLGLADEVTREDAADAGGGDPRTKDYSYDANGDRVELTTQNGASSPQVFSYGYDVHGSVSLLLDGAGSARAAYGYQAYGDDDKDLTSERDADNPAQPAAPNKPTNPYRYEAKRQDPGSGLLDMGARQFSPDLRQFAQRDMYEDPLGQLDLTSDPLTANPYSLAGGNPISFVEDDGHMPIFDGDVKAARAYARARVRGLAKAARPYYGGWTTATTDPNNGRPRTPIYDAAGHYARAANGKPFTLPEIDTPMTSERERGNALVDAAAGVAISMLNTLGDVAIGLEGVPDVGPESAAAGKGLKSAARGLEGAVGKEATAVRQATGPIVRYDRRAQYGGAQTNSSAGRAIRGKAEGQNCPGCGRTMRSGTATQPVPEHSPPLLLHYYLRAGHAMTDAQRRAYARSEEAFDGAMCLSCQRSQGAELSRLSRLLAYLFGG